MLEQFFLQDTATDAAVVVRWESHLCLEGCEGRMIREIVGTADADRQHVLLDPGKFGLVRVAILGLPTYTEQVHRSGNCGTQRTRDSSRALLDGFADQATHVR